MKRNNNFILRELADKKILVPVGIGALDFNGVVTLNDTAAFLWEKLENEASREDLAQRLIDEYTVDQETADKAVDIFIEQMNEVGCIE